MTTWLLVEIGNVDHGLLVMANVINKNFSLHWLLSSVSRASLEQDVDVPPQIVTPESDEKGEESVAENEYEPLSSEQTAHTDDKSNGEAEKVYMPLDNKERYFLLAFNIF